VCSQQDISVYLKKHLKTRVLGCQVHYLESTTSTMDVAREFAGKYAPEGTAVIAGTQKSGRGRLGRTWFSPEGSLAMSLILRPSAAGMRLLPAISSLAVFHALQNLGVAAKIKWPNDVLIRGKKVCGILIESRMEAGEIQFCIIGIGINVDLDVGKFPEIAEIATSISAWLPGGITVPEVALHVLTEFESLYLKIDDEHLIRQAWVDNMETIGRHIRVNTGSGTEEGIAETVNGEGNLVLRRDDGSRFEIIAGDVTLLKD